jgi:hypothetical protein
MLEPSQNGIRMETKREKFVRLANARVGRALKDIQLIGNLANESTYEYRTDDVEQIFKTLNAAIKTCRSRFEKGDDGSGESFRLVP